MNDVFKCCPEHHAEPDQRGIRTHDLGQGLLCDRRLSSSECTRKLHFRLRKLTVLAGSRSASARSTSFSSCSLCADGHGTDPSDRAARRTRGTYLHRWLEVLGPRDLAERSYISARRHTLFRITDDTNLAARGFSLASNNELSLAGYVDVEARMLGSSTEPDAAPQSARLNTRVLLRLVVAHVDASSHPIGSAKREPPRSPRLALPHVYLSQL